MNYIYYCKNCNQTFSSAKDNVVRMCPTCNKLMHPTHITTDTWHTKTSEEKEEIKKEFASMPVPEIQTLSKDTRSFANSNSIGSALHISGIIYMILVLFCTLYLFNIDTFLAIVSGFIGVLGGLLLLGAGEAINLLQKIASKLS